MQCQVRVIEATRPGRSGGRRLIARGLSVTLRSLKLGAVEASRLNLRSAAAEGGIGLRAPPQGPIAFPDLWGARYASQRKNGCVPGALADESRGLRVRTPVE